MATHRRKARRTVWRGVATLVVLGFLALWAGALALELAPFLPGGVLRSSPSTSLPCTIVPAYPARCDTADEAATADA